jgi:hypothetical protein
VKACLWEWLRALSWLIMGMVTGVIMVAYGNGYRSYHGCLWEWLQELSWLIMGMVTGVVVVDYGNGYRHRSCL